MSKTNPKVDWFFNKDTQWKEEYEKLRQIILDCGLTEELKWGVPCYTWEDKNIVLIHGFKEYCAILFPKGALMKDPKHILIQQTENVQSARQVRFSNITEIYDLEPMLKKYIKEAVEIEKSGQKVELKKASEYPVPEEFQYKLDRMPDLKAAFESLTPGRQKGYLFYFSQPKQSKTREARMEKYMEKILSGRGLED
jgi:uncharacterized protein YdeI (YjbR/CyaY-like superfamily)